MKPAHQFENYTDYEFRTADIVGGGGARIRISLDDENPETAVVHVLLDMEDGEFIHEMESTMPTRDAKRILGIL